MKGFTIYPDGSKMETVEISGDITEEECEKKCDGLNGEVNGVICKCEVEWSRRIP